MFLKCGPYRVWCSIFYSKLVNCILFKIIVQPLVFVKGRGTCGSAERNVKIWINFRKSPRFSLTSPLSQEREKSSRPVFTMCGKPWCYFSLLSFYSLILSINIWIPIFNILFWILTLAHQYFKVNVIPRKPITYLS